HSGPEQPVRAGSADHHSLAPSALSELMERIMNTLPFRYRRMGYVALQVSDLDNTTRFATEVFALDAAGDTASGGRFFRSGPKHHDLLLVQGDGPAFLRAAYELET